jgi:hypothetical protein
MSDEQVFERHEGQHSGCGICFPLKLASLQWQSGGAGQRRHDDKTRSRDLESYQKLRRQGYQPKNVFGSTEIATQANTKWELEHSVVMPANISKEMDSRIEQTKELFNTVPSA